MDDYAAKPARPERSRPKRSLTLNGDTVNAASRIEGPTKTLACPILVSETTRAALVDAQPDLREVGEVEVRGRKQPIRLWTIGDDRPRARADVGDGLLLDA